TYSAQHKMNLLEPLGVESTDLDLEMESSAEDQAYAEKLLKSVGSQAGKLQVSVSPVSRQPYKVWPAQHFAKLSDWLIESQGAQLYFLYGPGEEHFIESVKKEMNNDPMPDVGIPDLLQTRALLGKMDIHFGNDNGLRHLAIAAGIPTLGIFGKPSAVSWTPPGPTQHRSVEYDPGCKQSCTYPECEHLSCIRDVPVDEVHQALKKLLNDHVL
ncbi:MAG: glycosyltransferase family 9 protein, partial [SAR324 cluster bacterium]|nr:glycosyltransferase family 9 protein [SAR324 cluster bacterium]